MKKSTALLLITALTLISLTACGNKDNSEEESIHKVEASNVAESREPTERKYEDTTKEPVIAPDRNNSTESSEETINTDISDIDMSITGNWIDGAGTSFSIYEEEDILKFSGHEADTDRRLYGTVQSDGETYIEFTQKKPKSDEEIAAELAQEQVEITEDLPEGEQKPGQDTELNVNDLYGSEEEFNKAMEAEQKAREEGTLNQDQYETIKYEITEKKVAIDENRIYMTISNESKTYNLYRYIE